MLAKCDAFSSQLFHLQGYVAAPRVQFLTRPVMALTSKSSQQWLNQARAHYRLTIFPDWEPTMGPDRHRTWQPSITCGVSYHASA